MSLLPQVGGDPAFKAWLDNHEFDEENSNFVVGDMLAAFKAGQEALVARPMCEAPVDGRRLLLLCRLVTAFERPAYGFAWRECAFVFRETPFGTEGCWKPWCGEGVFTTEVVSKENALGWLPLPETKVGDNG